MSSFATAALVASLMWPFGGGDKEKPKEGTLGTLQNQEAELPPEPAIEDANRRARDNYQQFLQQSQADPKLAAEAMRRIADLELEAAEAADVGGDAKAAYQKAAAGYRELLVKYPDDVRNDQVLYQLARAQEGSGDIAAGLASLDRLVAKYPQTPLLAEVQFRRGEIQFGQKRYAAAEDAYAKVLALGAATPYFEQSLYKQGWSRFKQDEHDKSLSDFFQLLDRRLGAVPAAKLEAHLDGLARPERELIDDSLRVMALSFISLGTRDSLRQQLAQHRDPAYGYLLYRGLAAAYLEQERYSDAAATLIGFVDDHPQHPQAPAFHMQAVAALEAGRFPAQALALREDFVRRFGLDQPFWKARAQTAQGPALDYLRESAWMLAQHHHALAQNAATKPADKPAQIAAAAQAYQRYVQYFPKDARAPQAQFLLGELLYDSGDLPGAITAYDAAAYNYPAHERSAEAGYAALLASQKREAQLQGDAKAVWHRQRLMASLRFADQFPTHQHAALVRSDAAAGLFEAGDLAPAIAAAERVVADPKADVATRRVSWQVIGHASFDQKNYARAEAAYLELQKLAEPGAAPDKDISERLAAAIYRQGEQAQAAGQPLQAAAMFSRVAEQAPDSSIRLTADYDAAMATLKAGQGAKAIPLLLAFRQRNAGDPLVAQVTQTLAVAYEQSGQPLEAAREFQRIADTAGGDPEVQREALWRAATLYQNADASAAERSLRQYIQRYPQRFDDSIEAYQRLLEMAQKRGDAAGEAEGRRRLVAYEAAGGERRTPRSRGLAAHAALALAQGSRDAYREIALTQPLKNSLAAKRKRMEEALAAYARAADYGVSEVLTESTYETAELYHDLAKAMKDSERPKSLDAAALEQYDLLLEEQYFPFEEKAITLHEANAHRAADGLYDAWVQKSYAELAALVPGRYAKPEAPEVPILPTPVGEPISSRAVQNYQAGLAALKAGDGMGAEAEFKALKDLPGAQVNLGLAYRRASRFADAEATLKAAAERWPKFAPAQHQLGLMLRQQGRFAEADAAYAKAIAADPGYAPALYDRAVLNELYLQQPQQALAGYEQYQALQPQPDEQVARWITDLRRRTGAAVPAAKAAE